MTDLIFQSSPRCWLAPSVQLLGGPHGMAHDQLKLTPLGRQELSCCGPTSDLLLETQPCRRYYLFKLDFTEVFVWVHVLYPFKVHLRGCVVVRSRETCGFFSICVLDIVVRGFVVDSAVWAVWCEVWCIHCDSAYLVDRYNGEHTLARGKYSE